MRNWLLIVLLTTSAGTGCRDAFRAHVDVVARAEDAELSVRRLAEIIASAADVPVEREVVELLARRWVEFTLLARRAAGGDSLLDSAIVARAMWPDVRRIMVDSLRAVLWVDAAVTDAAVDSAYRAGNLRFIAHVLQRTGSEASPEEREAKRGAAEGILARLEAGESWESLNRLNDDSIAAARGGLIGPVVRGTTVPRFENVAFALAPGEVSGVTETNSGFHIIFRPELGDVRAAFREAVEAQLRARADSVLAQQLMESRRVEVRPSAPAAIREAARDPFRARGSTKVLASYDGGRFGVDDLVRWIHVLRPEIVQRLGQAPDEQLVMLTRSLVSQELLWQHADSMGIRLSPEQFDVVRTRYAQQLALLRGLLGANTDSVASARPADERNVRVDLLVDRYLEAAAASTVRFVPVPPFLAQQLLDDADWSVRTAGVARVVDRARRMRAATQPAGPTTPGGN